MSKVAQLRALREAQFSGQSLTKSRAETPKTTKPVVNETHETAKSVGSVSTPVTDTTKSAGALPDDFKELMAIADLTQKQFAEITGTPLRTVEDWSRGASSPPPVAKAWLKLWIETG